ncbi:MAG: hypothetical protein N2F24_15585 [Deltaproteobacteria bacterium]
MTDDLQSLNRPSRSRKAGAIAYRVFTVLYMALFTSLVTAAETDTVAGEYIALALQGEPGKAGHLFNSIESHSGSTLDHHLAEKFRHRFILRDEDQPVSTGNIFTDQLLSIYRQYWTLSMMGEFSSLDGMEWLNSKVNKSLIYHNYISYSKNKDEIMESPAEALAQQGVYSDSSFSSPWHDLLLWNTQESRSFVIELTDSQQVVNVVFMDDFYSLGWSEFATLGMTSTGGWAARDALYCVSWAWNQDSENFQVSFLQHEGRHFADFDQFPELNIIDLEYRAKLTELAFASSTLPRILDKFTINGSLNPNSPHAYANYQVTRDLYHALYDSEMPEAGKPWQRVKPEEVNSAARALLTQHTRQLENEGALMTEGIIYKQISKIGPGGKQDASQ